MSGNILQYCVQIRWQEIVMKYGWLKIHPKNPTVIEGNHVSPLFDQPSSNNTCISNQMPLSIFLKIWKPKVPNCFLMNCYISLLHITSDKNLHFSNNGVTEQRDRSLPNLRNSMVIWINIARIPNAVHVTLWLSVTNLQWSLSFLICQE